MVTENQIRTAVALGELKTVSVDALVDVIVNGNNAHNAAAKFNVKRQSLECNCKRAKIFLDNCKKILAQ